MSMTLTTSTGNDDSAEWIFDPSLEDDAAFSINTSAMTVCDILDALNLDFGDMPDPTWSLAVVKPALACALNACDPDDDYLTPHLVKLDAVIAAGETRGAQYLMAS